MYELNERGNFNITELNESSSFYNLHIRPLKSSGSTLSDYINFLDAIRNNFELNDFAIKTLYFCSMPFNLDDDVFNKLYNDIYSLISEGRGTSITNDTWNKYKNSMDSSIYSKKNMLFGFFESLDDIKKRGEIMGKLFGLYINAF